MIKYRIGEERHYTKRNEDIIFPLYFTEVKDVICCRIKNYDCQKQKIYRSINGKKYVEINDHDLINDLK